jgi:hypothetical protein
MIAAKPNVEEYLSIEAVADRLSISPKTVKNKMAKGVFKLGVHYFRPPGLGPRFKWTAIVAWMEKSCEPPREGDNLIPMPLHYRLRKSDIKKNDLAS